MAQKRSKRGLGRGLGALIQDTSAPEPADETVVESTEPNDKGKSTPKQESPKENPDVAGRYLDEDKNVSRERSRPSDLFFGGDVKPKSSSGKRVEMPNPLGTRRRPSEEKKPDTVATDETSTQVDSNYRDVELDKIEPNPNQPREYFDEDDMRELVASISEVGVLQPIVVRASGDDRYQIIMGERRWRASQRAGLDTIPVIVRDTNDEEMLREALLENIHRSELNPLEEAAAYEQLMKDFGWSQEILSKRVGRSRPHISNTLRLMRLPSSIQPKVASGVLSAGHARALLGLDNPADMETVADRIVTDGLSVRATEELVALYNKRDAPDSRTPSARRDQARFEELATLFGDELDTSVKINLGAKKGKISIDFASVEDLNRIMDIIQPSRRHG